MKKFLSVLVFSLFLGGSSFAVPVDIDLTVGISEPVPGIPNIGKNPVSIPVVTLDDHELEFQTLHAAFTLYIIRAVGDGQTFVRQLLY